jgi:branched-chain amino acid transport system substrate-binding protein
MKRSALAGFIAISTLGGASALAADPPIKIAGSFDLSGAAAAIGQETKTGAEYAVELLNQHGGVLGRKIELTLEDNGTNTQRAVSQSNQLARSGIDLLLAPTSTGSTLAVSAAVSAKLKLLMCVSASAGDDITMKSFQPYMFSAASSQYMMFRAAAVYAAEKGYKRIGLIATDTAGGHIGIERFKEFVKELIPDAQIVVEEYPKVGSSDFTPMLNKVMAAKPDYVFGNMFGTDIVTISKQGEAVGFFKQINNQFAVLYDANTLSILGDQAVIGTIGYTRAPFNYILKVSPEGKAYVEAFKARFGSYPGDETTMAYDCVMTWAAAVEKAKTTEPDAVLKAIETTEFDSPRGKFRYAVYDHMGNFPVFLGHVVPSNEYGQPVLDIEVVVPGDKARPTEAEVLKSRASN